MPQKLSTIVEKIDSVPNKNNAKLLKGFHAYMQEVGASERHQGNELLALIYFGKHLGKRSFLQVWSRKHIIRFLDSKKKPKSIDPDEKWKTTWNDFLGSIKHFFRWLHCQRGKRNMIPTSEWETPSFVQIKKQRSKRLSPYSESEVWDLEELLTVVKYESHRRNKAALTLFWDLDARNHKVTLLKNKNIRLRERYGEGEVPFESKTGSGPVILSVSFPWVRDWLNAHPAKDNPEAHLIPNLRNGGPVRPDAMWRMMKQLRKRIIRLLKKGEIDSPQEREKLEYLLKTKKWNPYCIRHSAISHDSDYLPEFALRKKVRWSMNSKQPSRYIKKRMGDTLRNNILAHNGILPEEAKPRKTVIDCPRCRYVNALQNRVCQSCGYPLSQDALDEIKVEEENRIFELQEQLKRQQEESDRRYQHVLSLIQQNPKLINIKPEVLEKLMPEPGRRNEEVPL